MYGISARHTNVEMASISAVVVCKLHIYVSISNCNLSFGLSLAILESKYVFMSIS
jgi:hypothetical protein